MAIGDTVTDAFIHLKDPSAHVDIDHGVREICMRFADKIPYEEVVVVPAVGNSANAAVSAARLGLKSALVTNLGEDYFGKECLDILSAEKVSNEFIKSHKGFKTNYHYVLWYDAERTILVKHERFPYVMPDINNPKWVYLSSLGSSSGDFHQEIEKYLNTHPDIKLAFQPGTFQMSMSKEKLSGIYKRSEVFFCNREEAQRILNKPDENDIKVLMQGMAELGPKVVVITDGTKGAYAYDGKEVLYLMEYPDPKPPYERTGAGDAFASAFTVALICGLSVYDALRWGPVDSMSVVQYVGAREGLLTREKLEEYLKNAPKDYKPKII